MLDSLINSWHDVIGMSNRLRDSLPENSLRYQYRRNGVSEFNIRSATGGVGDVRLSAAWAVGRGTPNRSWTMRSTLKLPTGRPEALLGSGATDLALDINMVNAEWLSAWHTMLYGRAGFVWLGQGDVLPQAQRDVAAYGTLGATWDYWPRVSLKMQFDLHSSVYDSELGALDSHAIIWTFGATARLSERIALDMGISEDLDTVVTPDVVVHLGLRRTF